MVLARAAVALLAALALFATVARADNVYCNGLSWVGDEHPLTTTWTQVVVSGTAPSVSRNANSTLSWITFTTGTAGGMAVYAAPSSSTVTLPYPFASATFLIRVFIADGSSQNRYFYIGLFNGTHFVFAGFSYTTSLYVTVCTSTLSCSYTGGVSITSVASTWITINMTVTGSTLYLNIPERGVTLSYAPAGYFPSFFKKGVRLAVGAYGYTAGAPIGTVYVDWLRAAAGGSPPTARLVSSSNIQDITVASGPVGFGNSTKCFANNLFNAWVPWPAPTPPLIFADNPPHAYALNATAATGTMAISDTANRFLIYAPTATVFSNIPITVNSTIIEAPPEFFSTRATLLILPPSSRASVSFIVNDYGQGYTHLIAKDTFGRLVAVRQLSAADRSAVLNLTAYQNYVISLWKPGEERVLGPVTVSQTQYSLTVLPQLQPAPPPSTAVVWYNSSLPGYVVDVSCASPPCTITLVKKQATQPQLLAAEFTVSSGGATIAPHLFMWSFDGVDDYVFVGLQRDGTGKPLSVYGWSEITIAERWLLLQQPPDYRRFSRFGIGGSIPSTTAAVTPTGTQVWMVACSSSKCNYYAWSPSNAVIYNGWVTVLRTFSLFTREFSVWLDGVKVFKATVPEQEVTILDYNTTSNYYKRFSLGADNDGAYPMKMMQSYVVFLRRALSAAEVAALQQYIINAAQLEAFFDPTWFNGTHYVSLTGGYVGKGYNGAARIPDNSTWLWLVQGLPGDGKLHFRFFPEGSRATVWCSSTLLDVQLGWSDVAVQVPAGESCRVAVHVAPQPYVLETASYTCGEARCRFTWITSDPFLEARVEDAAGSTYVVFSGTSLPQQPGGLPGLADLINWLAGSTGLDYLVGPGAVQAFLVALSSVLLLIAFSTAGSWEFGLLAAAAGLVLLPVLLGAPPLAVPAGLIIALAALSLMLRKEREE